MKRQRLPPPLLRLIVIAYSCFLGGILFVFGRGRSCADAFSYHRSTTISTSFPNKNRNRNCWRKQQSSSFATATTTTTKSSTRLYTTDTNTNSKDNNDRRESKDTTTARTKFASRFRSNVTSLEDAATIDTPCLLTIDNKLYDVQAFAKAHPGGSKILLQFHDRDATLAFDRAGHSPKARQMLKEYEVVTQDVDATTKDVAEVVQSKTRKQQSSTPLWRQKLFTNEDPIGYHKYLGIFCLLHYIYRYGQILASGSSGVAISNFVKSKWLPLWLLPHLLLNASAFIFHTVPKERIVGSPMIWKEYRVHNLIFVARSIVCTLLLSLSLNASPSTEIWKRKIAVVGSVVAILASNVGADITTHYLQPTQGDSSVGTLPFWNDCSPATQQRFKLFYAYCQFMATMACLMVSYPLWPVAVMMPIQFSSILLTLVRKSLLSAKGWHVAYLISLLFPFVAAAYPTFINPTKTICWDAPIAFLAGTSLFVLRCWGISKYWLWGILGSLRIVFGDQFIRYDIW